MGRARLVAGDAAVSIDAWPRRRAVCEFPPKHDFITPRDSGMTVPRPSRSRRVSRQPDSTDGQFSRRGAPPGLPPRAGPTTGRRPHGLPPWRCVRRFGRSGLTWSPAGRRSLRTQRNSIKRLGPCRSPASVECRPGEADRPNLSWPSGPAALERTSCSGNGGYPDRQCPGAPPSVPAKLGVNATGEPPPVCERGKASSSSPRQPPAVPFRSATSIPRPHACRSKPQPANEARARSRRSACR